MPHTNCHDVSGNHVNKFSWHPGANVMRYTAKDRLCVFVMVSIINHVVMREWDAKAVSHYPLAPS